MSRRKLDFVVFSDDWGRHASSCQHLFARLARRHRVLWVNTIGMRAPKADGFTVGRGLDKLRQWRRPLRRIHENLHVYAPAMLPVAGGSTGAFNARWVARRLRRVMRRLNFRDPILFTSVPTGADYLGRLGEQASVYYITDDYGSWPGADGEVIAAQDATLTAEADLLLPVGDALAADRNRPGRCELLPHAVDLDHFAAAADIDEPADLAAIGHPRLCFFGLIYEKIDLPLLARLARTQPDKHIVLIGPVKTDLSAVRDLPNVHVLGPKPYEQLPAYLNHMDGLLLAYELDEQVAKNAPLKIRECLAVGKPIVAKGMRDLDRYADLVHVTDSDEAYLAACQDALTCPKATAEQMRQAVTADTWEARAEQVERAIDRILTTGSETAGRVDIDVCTDAAEWDQYVAGNEAACVWHRWAWPAAMRSTYSMKCTPLAARRNGRLVGILPLALQSSRLFGRRLASLPWLDHAGAVADDEQVRQALTSAAIDLARRSGAELTLRQRAAGAADDARATSERSDKVAMTLTLPDDAQTLWDGFRAKVRNQIRKARKHGLSAGWAGADRLDEFYRVYATNMRDLGSPPHARAFFAELFRQMPDAARLMLVEQAGRCVAGAFVLTDRAGWQVPWASSLRSANATCPSHLMYWSILESACGQAPQFCFGRSSRDSGTYRFKAQWGAVEEPLLWRTYLGEADARDGQDSPTVELIQRLWRRMPVAMARTLGPKIIRCVG